MTTEDASLVHHMQDLYKRLRKVFRQHRSRGGLTLVDNLHDKPASAAWYGYLSACNALALSIEPTKDSRLMI